MTTFMLIANEHKSEQQQTQNTLPLAQPVYTYINTNRKETSHKEEDAVVLT